MASLNGNKQELTSEQLQVLRDEIFLLPTASNYAGQSVGGRCKFLNEKPMINNPEAQGTIQPSTMVSLQEVLELISWDSLKKLKKNADGAIALGFLSSLGDIDLLQENVQAAIDDVLQSALVSQEEVDTLNAKIAPIQDPDWQAQIPGPSRAEELLGAGYMVEGTDIRTAQAL